MTADGREARFPLFLASAIEQVLSEVVSGGYGKEDDSLPTKVHLPLDYTSVFKQGIAKGRGAEDTKNLKLVAQAMAGIHLVAAAAAEAMSLGVYVGVDAKKLYEIILTAVWTSKMLVDRVPQLPSG
ncbi:hypothetical protein BJ878DRAFT_253435 [Calycina marina]|uniref:3-hydroxyisobutyrate dehydrogenase-like NAD-binding domain-containing protein n=1 Tax=Calycina marina TaxID=1763456 RepID=A0A9P7YX69_9HELO|nr:hypothetical protein BJ878DRAFT_253435 [Calycina marina]